MADCFEILLGIMVCNPTNAFLQRRTVSILTPAASCRVLLKLDSTGAGHADDADMHDSVTADCWRISRLVRDWYESGYMCRIAKIG